MSSLPITRTCARCSRPFYAMPHRIAKLPGAGALCPACRFLGEDAPPLEDKENMPAPARAWPCKICGRHSANRFYCPEHHEALSADVGFDPGDYGVEAQTLSVSAHSAFSIAALLSAGENEPEEDGEAGAP